jgi:hypothetical protein
MGGWARGQESGNFSLSYQFQSIITGNGASSTTSTSNNIFFNLGQQFGWGGFFSLSMNYYFSRDLKRISSYYLEMQDVPLGPYKLDATYGYTSFPLADATRFGSFNSSVNLGLRGGRLVLRTGKSDIYLFGGRLYGGLSFGDSESRVLGIYSSFPVNSRWRVGLGWMKLSNLPTVFEPMEAEDYHIFSAESAYQLLPELSLLADARMAIDDVSGNETDYLVKVGPYWKGRRLSAELYYTRATPGFPYLGGGMAWNREGFTFLGSYRPAGPLSMFAGIDTFNEDLARLLNRPVTDYTTLRTGLNLSIRRLPHLTVSYNHSSRQSSHLQQTTGDSSFGMLLLSLAQHYRRFYWSVYFNGGDFRDRVDPLGDYLFRRYAVQLRKTFISRAYLYLNGYYDYRRERSSGVVTRSANAQLGANLALASRLTLDFQFVYALNRREDTGLSSSNTGGGAGLVYYIRPLKLNVGLRYLYSRVSVDSGYNDGRYYHQIFLNVNKFLHWGGSRGGFLGGILKKRSKMAGLVFVDENVNGVRDDGEELLEGIEVLMDRRKVAATNAQGQFKVSSIEPGTHTLSLDMRNIPAFYEPARDKTEVVLEKGKTVQVNLPVVPLGRLSGKLYLDVDENGERNENDRFLPDVLIVLYHEGEALRSVVSDSAGGFTFDNVRPGLYSIVVDEVDIQRAYTHTGRSILEVTVAPWEEKKGLELLVKKYHKPRKKKVLDDY